MCYIDRQYVNLASFEPREPTGDDVDKEDATFQYLSY